MEAARTGVEEAVAEALAAVDVERARERYLAQNEFLHLDRWLPAALTDRLVAEADAARPFIHRSHIPRHKKGGSVSFHTLRELAPTTVALYRSPAFVELVGRVTGGAARPCPERDPHSCALYFYTEPGDHIGFHFDPSFYRGARYTVLIGLIERSSSRLVCHLHRDDPTRAMEELRLATHPGTVVLFNGDKLWHAVSPLGEGEERVSLTFEYVTDPGMHPLKRAISDVKDAVAYFGVGAVFGRSARR